MEGSMRPSNNNSNMRNISYDFKYKQVCTKSIMREQTLTFIILSEIVQNCSMFCE